MQIGACWGQGFHSHGNEDVAVNTVSAHGDHSAIFIIFIKDALLISMRTALITSLPLPVSAFQEA